jgi:hypothetical protein
MDLKKEQFCKYVIDEGYKDYPMQELGEIYERICKNEIKTDTLKSEKTYQRLGAFFTNDSTFLSNTFVEGQMFYKYGRKGKPHDRLVYFDEKHENLLWCQYENQKKSKVRKIATADIHEVKIGVDSSQVLFSNRVDDYLDNRVFSIHSTKRTLDLMAPEEAVRNRWVKYLNNIINL